MPSYEGFQASNSGVDLLELYDINSFEFYVGGFFWTSHYIYINGKCKNKVIRYGEIPGGMYVDLKHPKSIVNYCPEALIKQIPLLDKQWLEFIKELQTLELSCWRSFIKVLNKYIGESVE